MRDVRVDAPLGLLDAGEPVRISVRTSTPALRIRVVLSHDRRYDRTDFALRRLRVVARGAKRARLRAVVPRGVPPAVPLRLVVCARSRGSPRQRCGARSGRVLVTDGTSAARIAGAAALGRLSTDREIRYRLQAAFMPLKLPKKIRGKLAPRFNSATPILGDAVAQWDRLSPTTRALAARYLVPPLYDSADTGTRVSRRRLARYSAVPCTAGDVEGRILQSSLWDEEETAVPAMVHWLKAENSNAALAKTLADELDRVVWPELTRLMSDNPMAGVTRDVPPDSGPCKGPDSRLDIYLVKPRGRLATTRGYTVALSACDSSASFIVLDPAKADGSSLAHEFMHLLINTYERRTCEHYKYLEEAAATWAMGIAYKGDALRLDFRKLVNNAGNWFGPANDDDAGYHGWPFLDSIARRRGNAVVAAAFSAAQGADSYSALDQAVGGSLADEWAHFAALALNEPLGRQVPESFEQWYGWRAKPSVAPRRLRRGKQDIRRFKLPTAVTGMGRQYYDLRISDRPAKTRYVALDDLGALRSSPTFRSVIYYRTETGAWHREDLTRVARREFCRDGFLSTNVERVVIINSITERPGTLMHSGQPSITLGKRCPKSARPKPLTLPCQPNGCVIELLGVSGRESWSATTLSGPSWDQCTTTASATHTYSGGAAEAGGVLKIRDETIEVRLRKRHYYLPELELRARWDRIGSGEETRRCHDTISEVTETTTCNGQGSRSGEVEVIGVTPDDAYELDQLADTIEVDLTHLRSTLFVPGTVTGYERTPPDPNPDSPVGQECSVDAAGPLSGSSEGQSTTPATRISTQALLSGQPVSATTTTTQTIGDSSASWNLSVTFRIAAAPASGPPS